MQSIIDRVTENLKAEFIELFNGIPSIEEVEEFSWSKLKRAAAELTEAYAQEMDPGRAESGRTGC